MSIVADELHVRLAGDRVGRYVIADERPDGTLVLTPRDSRMPVSRRPGYAPVVFDDRLWSQDLTRTSTRGRSVAISARHQYERRGCLVSSLRRCDEEGPDGTRLPGCVKVYLPPPA